MSSIITFASLIVTVMASGIVPQATRVSDYGTVQRYPWHKQEERVRNRPSNLLTLQDFLRMQNAGAKGERTIKTDDHIGKISEETEGKKDQAAINREGVKVSDIGEESVNARMYRTRQEGRMRSKEETELHHVNDFQTMDGNNFNMSIGGREDELRSPDIELNKWRDSTDYGADFKSSWRPFQYNSVVDEKHLIENESPVESLKYVINSLKEITSQYDGVISLDAEDKNTTLKNNILKGIEMGIGYLKSGFSGVLMASERLIDDYFGNGTRNKHFNSGNNTHLRVNKGIYVYDREGYSFSYPPHERSEQDGKVRDERHVVERMDPDVDGYYGGDMEQLQDNRMLVDKRSEDTRNATSERSESSSDYVDLSLDCLLDSSECDDEDEPDNSSYDVAEVRKHRDRKKKRKRRKEERRKKLMEKILLPLLISYKLKFFALIPVLVSGLVLLVGSTGLAGFFIALFAAVLTIKLQHQS